MDTCRHCSDVIFKTCASPGILIDGKLCCQIEELNTGATCSQCGETLRMGHFALDNTYNIFWCEKCLVELYEKLEGKKG